MVPARPARRRRAGLGELRRDLGQRHLAPQLKLADVRLFEAPATAARPTSSQASPERDIVFAWNGTTSACASPMRDWIARRPRGPHHLAMPPRPAFAMALPGTSSMSPPGRAEGAGRRSPARHDRAQPARHRAPRRATGHRGRLPCIFRLDAQNGRLIEGIFKGETINTPPLPRGRGSPRRPEVGGAHRVACRRCPPAPRPTSRPSRPGWRARPCRVPCRRQGPTAPARRFA